MFSLYDLEIEMELNFIFIDNLLKKLLMIIKIVKLLLLIDYYKDMCF